MELHIATAIELVVNEVALDPVLALASVVVALVDELTIMALTTIK